MSSVALVPFVTLSCGSPAITWGDPQVVSNVDGASCPEDELMLIAPAPDEYGFRSAARLTPPEYPFLVDTVSIMFAVFEGENGNNCLGEEQTIELFVGSEARPSEAPEVVARRSAVPSIPAGLDYTRLVEVSPDQELVLEDGDHLFVSVQMNGRSTGDGLHATCVTGCKERFEPDRDFWSTASSPPFGWVELASFGLPFEANAMVAVVGRAPGEPDDGGGGGGGGGGGQCGGSPTSCTSLFDSFSCGTQYGCYWNSSGNYCSGIASSCSTFDASSCASQRGCTWQN